MTITSPKALEKKNKSILMLTEVPLSGSHFPKSCKLYIGDRLIEKAINI